MSSKTEAKLDNQATDYVVSAVKAVLSAAPFVGSALAEFAGVLIPNQRMDRVAAFVLELERRLSQSEQAKLADRLQAPEFGEVVEESLRQASASLSEDRRKYLAALVQTALDSEQISAADSRHMLRLLGQINDVEVIVLRSHLVETLSGDDEFRSQHSAVLDPVAATLGSGQDEIDREALWEGYRFHLAELGLLQEKLAVDNRTKQPVFEASQGRFKIAGHRLTALGRLLLRMIDFTEDGFTPKPTEVTVEQPP